MTEPTKEINPPDGKALSKIPGYGIWTQIYISKEEAKKIWPDANKEEK